MTKWSIQSWYTLTLVGNLIGILFVSFCLKSRKLKLVYSVCLLIRSFKKSVFLTIRNEQLDNCGQTGSGNIFGYVTKTGCGDDGLRMKLKNDTLLRSTRNSWSAINKTQPGSATSETIYSFACSSKVPTRTPCFWKSTIFLTRQL